MQQERVPLGGTDPGADFSGAATLASVVFPKAIGGYSTDHVKTWRRRALNTIAYLESQVEALQVQLRSTQSAIEDSGPEAIGHGLVIMVKAMRSKMTDERWREWAAATVASLMTAASEAEVDDMARSFISELSALGKIGAAGAGAR